LAGGAIDPKVEAMTRRIPAHIVEALKTYRRLLTAEFADRVDTLSLYGSRARGEATEESDIDVLVCIRGASSSEQNLAAALAGDVATATGVWLSPTIYATERFQWLLSIESPFARSVLADQIPL
jgi:predicted nucleotidyltransferase